MSVTNTAFTATGLLQLLSQFDGSPNLRDLASSFLDQAQALEDAAHPLLAERSLDNMTGHRLDGFGQVVAVMRAGRTDEEYRTRLRAELAILLSNGLAEDLLNIAQLLIQMTTADYELVEYYPKTIYIRPVDHVLTSDPVAVGSQLRRAVSAATEMLFVYSLFDDSETFTLSSQGATVETSTALGLGSVSGGYNYTYEINVGTGGGFGDGEIRFDGDPITTATTCRVKDIDGDGTDRDAWLDGLDGEAMTITVPGGNINFTVTSVTDVGTYHELDSSSFSILGTAPANADPVIIWNATTGGHLSGAA